MDFAVTVEGLHEEGRAAWVLAVDNVTPGGAVLIAHEEDKSLHWHLLAECTLAKVSPPDQPRPVYQVQMKPRNGIVTPNRQARRRGDIE